MQTVGAFLVVAMVVTPGATAYLLTDRFPRLLALAAGIGAATGFFGAYISYFLDGATGGVIVLLHRPEDGEALVVRAHSVCLHGDTPGSVGLARAVRDALMAAGVQLAPPGAS